MKVTKIDPGSQLLQCRIRRQAFYLDSVDFIQFVARIRDLRLQGTIVRQDHEPLGIGIESACGVYPAN